MLKLQDTKLGLSDAALGEGTLGKNLERVSVKQIRDVRRPSSSRSQNLAPDAVLDHVTQLFGMNRNKDAERNQSQNEEQSQSQSEQQ